jgi:hypothetical protein
MLVFIQSSIRNTFKSVAAAFFGVQNESSRRRDFSQGKLSHFIIVGIICVLIFIAALVAIVSLVIPSTV